MLLGLLSHFKLDLLFGLDELIGVCPFRVLKQALEERTGLQVHGQARVLTDLAVELDLVPDLLLALGCRIGPQNLEIELTLDGVP